MTRYAPTRSLIRSNAEFPNGLTASTILLSGSTSGYVGLSPAAIAGSVTYTLPASAPVGTGYALTSTTGGIMSWVSLTTGTVTSVAALTIGTTGTDVASSVATGTTTPVITLNIPTASATNRGALSATDWSAFNAKQAGNANLTAIATMGTPTISGILTKLSNNTWYLDETSYYSNSSYIQHTGINGADFGGVANSRTKTYALYRFVDADITTGAYTKTAVSITSSGAWTATGAVARALYVTATGATTNYAAIFDQGNVGIGTSSPGSTLDVKGTLRLSGSTSGYVGFSVPANAGSTTYLLPAADGTNGQVLSTNGTATLSWVTASGGGGASLSTANSWSADQTLISSSNLIFSSILSTVENSRAKIWGATKTITSGSTTAIVSALNFQPSTDTSGSFMAADDSINFDRVILRILSNDNVVIGYGEGTSGTGSYVGSAKLRAPNGGGTNNSGGAFYLSGGIGVGGTPSSGSIIFQTGEGGQSAGVQHVLTERMRISGSAGGYVGIGTTIPGSTLDIKGTLRLSGSTSGYVGFSVPADAGSTTYLLPAADGTNGQVLSTNGTGTLSWVTASGGGYTNTSSIAHVNPDGGTFGGAAASKTATYTLYSFLNNDTSPSSSVILKTAVSIISSGSMPGMSSYNRALYVTASGAYSGNNYAAIFDQGKVGIGTTSPGSTLDVKGTFRLSGSTSGSVVFSVAADAGSTTYLLPTADGTNGQVLSTNGAATLSWATPAAGPITQVTFAESTAAPNTTVYVDSMTAAATTTNADLALSPKGTGALTAQVANSTATGGNKRGANATDWQRSRTNALMVASGSAATIGGGYDNRATGNEAVVAGGNTNSATGSQSSIGGGSVNSATGSQSTVVGGDNNASSGVHATVLGGEWNNAIGTSSIAGGNYANAELQGKFAYASGRFWSTGDAQFGLQICRATTTTNAAVNLTNDGSGTFSATNHLVLPNNRVYRFTIDLVASSGTIGTASTSTYGSFGGYWTITGAIRRAATASTTAMIGTPTVVATSVDSQLAAVTFTHLANTTYGSLQIVATGLATTQIHWVAIIMTTEAG